MKIDLLLEKLEERQVLFISHGFGGEGAQYRLLCLLSCKFSLRICMGMRAGRPQKQQRHFELFAAPNIAHLRCPSSTPQ